MAQRRSKDDDVDSKWICKICLDGLKKPVVTQCGHLFCWKCLYRWLERAQTCPVCSGAINKSLITPIFGHDTDEDQNTNSNHEEKDDIKSNDDDDIPSRPAGNRQEAPRRNNSGGPHFEFYVFGLGIHSIVAGLSALLQNTSDTPEYASEQDRFDDLCSKAIIVFLVFLIIGILAGMI